MSSTYYDYYDGSKMFIFISNRLGLLVDLVSTSTQFEITFRTFLSSNRKLSLIKHST